MSDPEYRYVTRSKALPAPYNYVVMALFVVVNVMGFCCFFLTRMFVDHDFPVSEIALPLRSWVEASCPGAGVVVTVWAAANVALLGVAWLLPGETTTSVKPSRRS